MDHEIHKWVNSDQDYFTGVQIYDRYGRNPNLARILRRGGATVKNRLTLSYELGKIAKQIAVSDSTPALVKPQVKQEIQKAELPVPSEVITIDKLRSEQKMCYKMLDNLHAILPYKEKPERMNIAFQILELDDRLKEITIRIEHFDKHGVIPAQPVKDEPKTLSDLNTAELIKRQMTVRTYITRYKIKLEKSKSLKKRTRYQQLLDKYQLEMDDINKKLGQ